MDALQDRVTEKEKARDRRNQLGCVKAKWARRALFVCDGGDIDPLGRVIYSREGRDIPVVSWDDVEYLRERFVLYHYSHGSWRVREWWGTDKDTLTCQELRARDAFEDMLENM